MLNGNTLILRILRVICGKQFITGAPAQVFNHLSEYILKPVKALIIIIVAYNIISNKSA